MADNSVTLDELKQLVTEFRDLRDWKQFHNPKDLASAISIESAELLENFLWKDKSEVGALLADSLKMERIRDELADIMIFCLSLADITGVDLPTAIQQKLEKNAAKYPVEKARGSTKKYTEL
jgi:dCTP diphosphatase